MYLWLSCEGWVSFGPFEWLKFEDENRCIKDQNGNIIAKYDGNCWHVTDKKYKDYAGWSNPMITPTAKHPHPMHS